MKNSNICGSRKRQFYVVQLLPCVSRISVAGNSDAGRSITGIHFYGIGGAGLKLAVVIHGGVHAREWISPMVRMILLCSSIGISLILR